MSPWQRWGAPCHWVVVVGQSVHPAWGRRTFKYVVLVVVVVVVMVRMMVTETKMMVGSMGRLALSGQRSIEMDGSS